MIDGRDVGPERRLNQHPITTVGAGLLAKAVGQATLMSTDLPHSRASPLPQGNYLPGDHCGRLELQRFNRWSSGWHYHLPQRC
ncbi:hypothetical protein C0J26_02525 [Pseudomonas baetica]|nr:hypothetical protein C0J26_02525 [Pseudomonas baetica]